MSMSKCVGQASALFFYEGDLTVLSLSITEVMNLAPIAGDALVLDELFTRSNMTIVIKKTNAPAGESYIKTINNYILQIRHPDEFEQSLQVLRSLPTWNSEAKFLIISAAIFFDPKFVVDEIIKQLWRKKALNAVVMLSEPNSSSTFNVYAWNPSWEFTCDVTPKDVAIIDRCTNGSLMVGKNWYPDKIRHNLKGCPLKVLAVIWPPYVLPPVLGKFINGIEVKLLNTIAEVINGSILYLYSNTSQKWGYIHENGSATGPLLELKEEHCDLLIGSFSATNERSRYFDYAIYSFRETLTWCVPHAKDADKWKKLLMVLPLEIFVSNYVLCIAVGLCLWGLCSLQSNEPNTYKSFAGGLQNSFAILYNIPVKAQPRYTKARLLFILWVLYSLHITAVYESSIISTLTKPRYDQEVNNLGDVLEKNWTVWVMENHGRYFQKRNDANALKLKKLTKVCEDIAICLWDTAINKHSATCAPRHVLEFAYQYIDNEEPLIHCFKNSIVSMPLEMLFVKGFPLTRDFRKLIGRITSSGLISHWEKQVYNTKLKSKVNKGRHGSQNQLGMSHLVMVFVLLFTGYVCGFIVLIIELYVMPKL
ncbi:uncharacterized protein LOC116167104 [Photinus pyralis]|uniref:uncharacterized protein LOC116167104 n=1 Tax=Photinus pyralis TaxID=7054 RepID=UPI001267304A|nr:uncharacterized protein LOC116167104 [Photinus pyralis]